MKCGVLATARERHFKADNMIDLFENINMDDVLSFFREADETQFLPGSGHIDTAIWMHYMDANKTTGEEARWQLHKNAACNPEQVLAATPHKTPTVRPPTPYHENYPS